MNKKFSAVVAAFVAVVLGVCFAVSSFGFVKDGYGENQISALYEIGLVEQRSPDSTVTRGEALVALIVVSGLDEFVIDYSPENFPCPYTDMSEDLEPYIAVAYFNRVIGDMPYDRFRENDNITLEEMIYMTLGAYGVVEKDTNIFNAAESHKIYKTCRADAFVFDLTYAAYAEILWNLLCAPSLYVENKTHGDLLVDCGFTTPEAYEAAKEIMDGYVFGQKHDYVTKALSWFDPSDDSESDSETDSDTSNDTTAPADTTTSSESSYDTEDNSGYSPPFIP